MIPYEDLVAQLVSWRVKNGLPVGHAHQAAAPSYAAPAAYTPPPAYAAPEQASEGFVNVGTGEFDMAEEGTSVGTRAVEGEGEGELDVDADAVIDEEHL